MWVALKRAGRCVVAFGGYVNCACVPQLFQQLINSMLCPAFLRKFTVNLFAVYLFKYKRCIKILSSSLNTTFIVDKCCSDVCCDEFLEPQIDRKSKKVKEQWHWKFSLQSVWRKTRYFKHRKYLTGRPFPEIMNEMWFFIDSIRHAHFLTYLLIMTHLVLDRQPSDIGLDKLGINI